VEVDCWGACRLGLGGRAVEVGVVGVDEGGQGPGGELPFLASVTVISVVPSAGGWLGSGLLTVR